MRRGKFNREAYDSWRAAIPFSNEEIAAEFEAYASELEEKSENHWIANKYRWRAKRVRAGHLARVDLFVILSRLVKVCAICGGKALYMQGHYGRCRKHRLVAQPEVVARRRRLQELSDTIAKDKKASDYRALATLSAKTMAINTNK